MEKRHGVADFGIGASGSDQKSYQDIPKEWKTVENWQDTQNTKNLEESDYNVAEGGDVNPEEEDAGNNDGRATWNNQLEFLMSCIAMSVGLGNLWRFPFIAYDNGGGAFLIPYIIVLIIVGKPMYFMEMIIGQFTSRSAVKIWALSPFFKGLGIGQVLGTCYVVSYYCSIIATTLLYLFASFHTELPWAYCREEWGSRCVDSKPNPSQANITNGTSSSEFFFLREVLKRKDSIDDGIGMPDLRMTLWLILTWLIIVFIIWRGVQSSGKVSYFLALFPYAVLFTLLIRAATLEGSGQGILHFIRPQFGQIFYPKVWKEAVVQCFFSLGTGIGPIITFSSYNPFRHNVYRDAMIVTTLDTFTSLLGGVTIFAVLGNLAHNLNVDIRQVVKGGSGLAFISYPDAISKFDFAPQLFAFLFFFMLLALGLGSAVALVSGIVTVLKDEFPQIPYWQWASGVSVTLFLVGLIYVTPGGQWMLELVDYYGGNLLVFALACLELVVICWVYGLRDFVMDTHFMTNRYMSAYWRYCWSIVTPLFMIIIFFYYLATLQPLQSGGKSYPKAAHYAGWAIMIIGLIQIPIWGIYVKGCDGNCIENLRKSLQPSEQHGPKSRRYYARWKEFKEDIKANNDIINQDRNYSNFQIWLRNFLGIYHY